MREPEQTAGLVRIATSATRAAGVNEGPSMSDYIQAWQCIGCGKIEAPQTCIGVCRDRKVVLVGLTEHQQALDEIQRVHAELEQARAILSQLAHSTPRDGLWENSYRALREQARRVLAEWSQREGGA